MKILFVVFQKDWFKLSRNTDEDEIKNFVNCKMT
jgi:hypothetical protein